MNHLVDTTTGARISYEVEGPSDAPSLLLINSIGSTREMWARNIPAFTHGYRVIRFDARGHGQSSVPQGEYAIDDLGRDALAVLDAAGAATAHVCGISLGGLTAMWMGVHAPDRIARLVLANTAARVGSKESWTERIALVRAQGMSAAADLAIPNWFTAEFRARDPETVRAFRTMLQSCPVDGYLGCCAALRDADLREDIARIASPALVIGGRTDKSTSLDGAELIRARIPGAQLVVLDSAHLSNVEQSEAFSSAVLDFLEQPSSVAR
jgi:3-oxoadipate enol-lactonase